jgi:DNA-binding NtrC family response regulator
MNRQFPRVLIVEDDESLCHTWARIFESYFRWDFRKAFRADAAIAALCGPERFDLVWLDLILPDAYGTCVLEHVNKCSSNTKVVVVTGKGKDEVADVEAMNPTLLLHKPIFFDAVRDLADRIWEDFFATRGRAAVPVVGVGVGAVAGGEGR